MSSLSTLLVRSAVAIGILALSSTASPSTASASVQQPERWSFTQDPGNPEYSATAEARTKVRYNSYLSLSLTCQSTSITAIVGYLDPDKAQVAAHGAEAVYGYLSKFNAAPKINVFKGGRVIASFAPTNLYDGRTVSRAQLDALQSADQITVTGGPEVVRFSAEGSSAAIDGVRIACKMPPAAGAAAAPPKSGQRPSTNPRPAAAAPRYPALAADIPPAFVAGTLVLKTAGGCTRFYDQNGRISIAEAVNRNDWNEAIRRVIDHGCSTNIGWYLLGLSAENLGQFATARAYYKTAFTTSFSQSFSNIYSNCAAHRGENPCLGISVPASSSIAAQRTLFPGKPQQAASTVATPQWLTGKWTYVGDCSGEATVSYHADGTLKDLWHTGTWRLDKGVIHLSMTGEQRAGKKATRYKVPKTSINGVRVIDTNRALLDVDGVPYGLTRCGADDLPVTG